MGRARKGQSVLEYVIVLTVIVAAIVAGVYLLTGKDNTKGMRKMMKDTGAKITTDSGKVANIVP